MRIYKSQLNFTGATQLTQYFVMDVGYTVRAKVEDGVSVTIVLGRKILSQILTTFLPTVRICPTKMKLESSNDSNAFLFIQMCICIVAFSTSFFDVSSK